MSAVKVIPKFTLHSMRMSGLPQPFLYFLQAPSGRLEKYMAPPAKPLLPHRNPSWSMPRAEASSVAWYNKVIKVCKRTRKCLLRWRTFGGFSAYQLSYLMILKIAVQRNAKSVWSAVSFPCISTTIDPKIVCSNHYVKFACVLQRLEIQFATSTKKATENPSKKHRADSIYSISFQLAAATDTSAECSYYGWWKKACSIWYGNYPISYRGFIHPRWCRISSMVHQQY